MIEKHTEKNKDEIECTNKKQNIIINTTKCHINDTKQLKVIKHQL